MQEKMQELSLAELDMVVGASGHTNVEYPIVDTPTDSVVAPPTGPLDD